MLMKPNSYIHRKTKIIFSGILATLILLGVFTLILTWSTNKKQVEAEAILTTQVIASMLNGVALVELINNPGDVDLLYYNSIKNRLTTEVRLDDRVNHVHIWTLRDNELVAVVDSVKVADVYFIEPGTPFSGPDNQTIDEYLSGEIFHDFLTTTNTSTIVISAPIRDQTTNELLAYFAMSFYRDGFYASAKEETIDIMILIFISLAALSVYYILHIQKLKIKQKSQQIYERNERFNSLAEQSKTITWEIDNNKRFTFVSPNALEILGYKVAELVNNKHLFELFQNNIDKEDNLHLLKLLNSRESLTKIRACLLSKKNELFYVSTTAIPIFSYDNKLIGHKGFFMDITEMEKTRKSLKYEKELADKYLDLAGVMLLVLNEHGNITLINKKGCEILKLKEDEILGKNWFDNFILPHLRDKVKKVFNAIMKDEVDPPTKYSNTIVNAQGEQRHIAWENSLLYDVNNVVIGILSSGDDITERKLYREKLIQMSYQDALTGLYNRRYYKEELPNYDTIENLPLTVVMSDINGLKLINDAFGHDSGDALLISSANLLSKHCRKRDLIARIGGDEFIILMPKTNEAEAEAIIKNISEDAQSITNQSIKLSISFGFKTKTNINESIIDICKSAEDIMYQQKLLETTSMRSGTIETILRALYEKDRNSEKHCRIVADISERLAIASGMNTIDTNEVRKAALLHDIGKIAISSEIINKAEKLTEQEYELMKNHSEIGFRILSSMPELKSIADIVLSHHERWDGKGYPRGIKGNLIPLKARVIAIADKYDAMTSKRTYRKTLTKQEALKEIIEHSATQFDPELVKLFKNKYTDIIL